LVIEDEGAIRFGVARHLERSGFEVAEAETCASARGRFRTFDPEAVVTDYHLPDGEALDLIADFRREKPSVPIMVFTGYGTIELAVRAVKTGADNLFTKPVDMDKLVAELRRACAAPAAHPGPSIVHAKPRDRTSSTLEREIERLRDVDCSLLILGETGTGKTRLARRLHDQSARHNAPFIDLNCAGLTRELVESELFGHERGAFTSAHASKPGMFEMADGGTLFLDEIGDIDAAVQPKVLKAIEEKRFRRMGGTRETVVDVRVIAATHRDLREAVRGNGFRADLYYRLSTVTLTLPPLRERCHEIVPLAHELLTALATRLGRPAPTLAAEAEATLTLHSWPGNVRELKNVLERALHLTRGDRITSHDLRVEDAAEGEGAHPSATLRDAERTLIERALALHGNVAEAARSLGISRSSMYMKVKAYGIAPPARGSSPKLKVAPRRDHEGSGS
jgi:DNA-binding NtrC family response regulator